jgi:CheY-like chemotaxis protein
MINIFNRGKNEPQVSVLVISDDPSAISLLKNMLNDGYVIHSATNSVDAVKLLDEIPLPDLFIGDFIHPQTDGKAFIERVRTRFGKTALPPVLFLMDTPDDESTAEEIGIQDVLPKPFETDALVQCIKSLLENARSMNA